MEMLNTKMKIARKYQGMLETIDNEGRESGIWAYSKRGYRFASTECHTEHSYSQKELYEAIKTLEPCQCQQCTPQCRKCGKTPDKLKEYQYKENPIQYVLEHERFTPDGYFYCTECYIKAGMPRF
jgi:hypothetical protein